jgi:hypothetical protein
LQPEDTLLDRGEDDVLDEGYSPPERPLAMEPHDSLESRLEEEIPDTAADGPEEDRADYPSREDQVGDERSGRLVAPDEGTGEDVDSDLIGSDVGIDGGAASAEEAAVHSLDEDEIGPDA